MWLLVVAGLSAPLVSQEEPDPLEAAGAALAAGDLDAAEAGFREALRRDPTSDRAWLGLSAFQAARGQVVEALGSARRADELTPGQEITLLTIARLQATLGGLSAALVTLERALELHPQSSDAWLLSALLLRDMNRAAEAIELLERARSQGVERPDILEELGLLLLREDRSAEALELAAEALEKNPERPRLHLIVGLALARDAERRDEAIGHLERALAGETGYPERIRLELSALLVQSDRAAEALEHLAEVERTRPEDPELFYRKGLALQATGDADAARAALERFQELKRVERETEAAAKRLGTRFNEAQELAGANRLEEALARVDEILEERPGHARTLALRGKVLFSMGRREEGLASLVEARRLDPGRLEHAYLEGFFLLNLGRAVEAEAALLRAVAIDATVAESYQLLGQAASRQEAYERSIGYFQRALDLGRDTAGLRLNYATALESLGRTEEYERQMEAYRRLTSEEDG